MRIAASPGTSLTLTRHDKAPAREHAADEPVRASLPAVIEPAGQRRDRAPSPQSRPVAALLAQLVASAEDLPATRAKRRMDPAAGTEIYRMMAGLGLGAPSRKARSV